VRPVQPQLTLWRR